MMDSGGCVLLTVEGDRDRVSGSEDRTYGMIAHGLVLFTGLSAFLGPLSYLGWVAAIASVVLYFVWKSKSPFVVRPAKQAAGLQVFLFAFSFVLFLITAMFTVRRGGDRLSRGPGGCGGHRRTVRPHRPRGRHRAIVCAVMGLLRAQKGEEYTYPVIGAFVDRLDV